METLILLKKKLIDQTKRIKNLKIMGHVEYSKNTKCIKKSSYNLNAL